MNKLVWIVVLTVAIWTGACWILLFSIKWLLNLNDEYCT
jgi:hypothetical protein